MPYAETIMEVRFQACWRTGQCFKPGCELQTCCVCGCSSHEALKNPQVSKESLQRQARPNTHTNTNTHTHNHSWSKDGFHFLGFVANALNGGGLGHWRAVWCIDQSLGPEVQRVRLRLNRELNSSQSAEVRPGVGSAGLGLLVCLSLRSWLLPLAVQPLALSFRERTSTCIKIESWLVAR